VTKLLSTLTGRGIAAAAALTALLFASGCGDQVLKGRAPSYLVVTVLQAASGAKPETFATVLQSDVLTNGGIFEDPGQVTLQLAMKDPTTLAGPSSTNAITVNRYHVDFVRSDGRNTQGVDVPYSFDGAMTGTVAAASTTLTFTLVRAQAKLEAPLMALRGAGGALLISTIANVTFYGVDQAGNAVSVGGSISINFADWADPL
jgi:hypothetical protein